MESFGNALASVGLTIVTIPEERFAYSCHASRVSEEIEMLCVSASASLCVQLRCAAVLPVVCCSAMLCCCAPLCSAACFCVLLCAVIVVDPIPQLSDPAAPRLCVEEPCAFTHDPNKNAHAHDAQTHANASTRTRSC